VGLVFLLSTDHRILAFAAGTKAKQLAMAQKKPGKTGLP
jgi:hypothetical protein